MKQKPVAAAGLYFTLFFLSFAVSGQTRVEENIGEEAFRSVESSMGFYEDESLLNYVKAIGKNLEAVLPDNPYTFQYFLVDTDEPNAFATAGGYVFVTRGILAILDTEDELAGVLGHELTHVLEKHSTRTMYRNMLPAILELPGNLLNVVFPDVIGNLINLPIELTSSTADAAFSRAQENDADRYGIEWAVKAGYDPEGLKSALLKLEAYSRERYHVEEHFTLFLDHPLTRERVEHLEKVQQDHQWQHREPTRILHHTDGLIIGKNPDQGLITPENEFLHPGLDLYIRFPGNWRLENAASSLHAMDETGQSGFAMGLDRKTEDLRAVVEKAAGKVDVKHYTVEPPLFYDWQEMQAAELVITGNDIERQGKTIISWMDLGIEGAYLQCIGTAHSYEEFRRLEEVIDSIRRLTEGEKDQIVYTVLYSDTGGEETLAQFAARKGPQVAEHLDWILLLNRMEPQESVYGKPVKYVQSEPYFSK